MCDEWFVWAVVVSSGQSVRLKLDDPSSNTAEVYILLLNCC